MYSFEKNIVSFIKGHIHLFFFTIISLFALIIRYFGLDYLSHDMSTFLIPWFDEFKALGGLKGLSRPIGNYGLLYQTIIAFMTYINYKLYLY